MLETILSFFPDVFFWFFGAIGVLGLLAGVLGFFMGNGGEGTKKFLITTVLLSIHCFIPMVVYYVLLHFIENKWICAIITMLFGVPAVFHLIGGRSKQEIQANGEKQEQQNSKVNDVQNDKVSNVNSGPKSQDDNRAMSGYGKAYLDRAWDILVSNRRAGKNVDSFLEPIAMMIVNCQKGIAMHKYISVGRVGTLPKEAKFDHWELKAVEMASVFLKVMTADFVPEEDLIKKKGIVPLSLFKFIISYGVLYSGDKQIKDVREVSLNGNYQINIDEMRKALIHCASLIDDASWNEKVEELNKCGDAEYRSITQSLLDGILQHLRGA